MFEELSTLGTKKLKDAFGEVDVKVMWMTPKDISHGDATTTVALELAKKLGKKPRDIAEVLSKELSSHSSIEKAEIAGAGYVNVWLKPQFLMKQLELTRKSCTPAVKKKAAPIIIDYSQPNIAKPLGVHHILSTVIGQALSNVYRHQGFDVIGWNYMGDWGTQFGKLAVAVQKWGDPKKKLSTYTLDQLLELYVRFHKEAEVDASLEDEGRDAFRRLEEGDKELRTFWKEISKITKDSLQDIYERLHVSFDTDIGESYFEDKMDPIVEEGTKKKVFVQGEKGALIVEFSEESKLPPAVVLKGDKATIYLTRDLALMKYRIQEYHPQSILFVVDVAQSLYFQQLFATVKKLDWELPHLEHVLFGRMRFADSSMSTRKGTVLKLEHVLDEAVAHADALIKERGDAIQTDDAKELGEIMGVGALVYGILSQNRKMDLVFDWDKMLSFDGNSAPYIQYTHARAKSILRKSEEKKFAMPKNIGALTEKERILISTLLQFSRVLADVLETHMPHKLANFLYQLCQDYNAFYNGEPILQAGNAESRALRLDLTSLTASVLKTGAELLTLRVPERM